MRPRRQLHRALPLPSLIGYEALQAHYEALRGRIFAARYEMSDTHVLECGNTAILSFRFDSWGESPSAPMRWNCTEAYRRNDSGHWRIVHTHWSLRNGNTT